MNVQVLWTPPSGSPWGLAYYESFFPSVEQKFGEGTEAITMTCKGGCFGVVEIIRGFGNRY